MHSLRHRSRSGTRFYPLVLLAAATAAGANPACDANRPPPDLMTRLACSLPLADPAWTVHRVQSDAREDGGLSASIEWRRGAQRQSASLIVHASLADALAAFDVDDTDPVQAAFAVDGVAEQAWMWPPKVPAGGAWNMRFRQAAVEVWIGGEQRQPLLDLARVLAAAIEAHDAGDDPAERQEPER